MVKEALEKAGRTDLIGFDKHCLIRPRKGEVLIKPVPKTQPKKPTKKPAPPKGKKSQMPAKPAKKIAPKPPSPQAMAQAERYLKKRKK